MDSDSSENQTDDSSEHQDINHDKPNESEASPEKTESDPDIKVEVKSEESASEDSKSKVVVHNEQPNHGEHDVKVIAPDVLQHQPDIKPDVTHHTPPAHHTDLHQVHPGVREFQRVHSVNSSKSKIPRNGKMGLFAVVILAVIVIIIAVTLMSGKKASGDNNGSSIKQVSNAFVLDLQQNNPVSAYHLETVTFQNLASKQVELSEPTKFVPNETTVMTGYATGTLKGRQIAEVTYRLYGQGKPLYLAISLEQNGNLWEVDGFDSSYTAITPHV